MNRRADRLAAWAGAAVALLLLWAAYAAGLLGYLLTEPGDVLRLLGQHVMLVLTSGATAVTLGTGLGIAISRARSAGWLIRSSSGWAWGRRCPPWPCWR